MATSFNWHPYGFRYGTLGWNNAHHFIRASSCTLLKKSSRQNVQYKKSICRTTPTLSSCLATHAHSPPTHHLDVIIHESIHPPPPSPTHPLVIHTVGSETHTHVAGPTQGARLHLGFLKFIPVLRIRDVILDPGSDIFPSRIRIFSIPDPHGSRIRIFSIPDPHQRIEVF